MMTWLVIYLTCNALFAALLLGWNYYQDAGRTNMLLQDYYEETGEAGLSTTATTVILLITFVFAAIPTFIYKSIKGDK